MNTHEIKITLLLVTLGVIMIWMPYIYLGAFLIVMGDLLIASIRLHISVTKYDKPQKNISN